MQVMTDADGTSPPYMPYAASGDSSRIAAPGSTSALMRSRGSSLPRARCFCARLLAAAAGGVRGLLAQVGDDAAHRLRIGAEFRASADRVST